LASLGGVLGVVWTLTLGGLISIPVGIALGVFVALAIAYHNVRTERDVLAAKADTRAKNQAVADALLPKAQFAIHELSNKAKHMVKDEDAKKFKETWRSWEQETKELLEKSGCTDAQVSSFWDLTEAEVLKYGMQHGPFHSNAFFNNRITWIEVRLERLKRIINTYSETTVFFFD